MGPSTHGRVSLRGGRRHVIHTNRTEGRTHGHRSRQANRFGGGRMKFKKSKVGERSTETNLLVVSYKLTELAATYYKLKLLAQLLSKHNKPQADCNTSELNFTMSFPFESGDGPFMTLLAPYSWGGGRGGAVCTEAEETITKCPLSAS